MSKAWTESAPLVVREAVARTVFAALPILGYANPPAFAAADMQA